MARAVAALCSAVFVTEAASAAVAAMAATGQTGMVFPGVRHRLQLKVAAEQRQEEVPVEDRTASNSSADSAALLVDVGADGFPALPQVSALLGGASATLKSLNSEASMLEARVVQAQMESEAKMGKQKAAFEQKLKAQEWTNRAVLSMNANISVAIDSLRQGNKALIQHAGELQEGNRFMRVELRNLESKLGVARDFVNTSLTSTDDSKSKDLVVLEKTTSLRHRVRRRHAIAEVAQDNTKSDQGDDSAQGKEEEADAGSDDDQRDDEEMVSFVALSSRTQRRMNAEAESFEAALAEIENAAPGMDLLTSAPKNTTDPADVLEVLSKGVSNLARQEKDSQQKLKALFIKGYRAGAKRHAALIVQQKGLNATRTMLTDERTKLRIAEEKLDGTRGKLRQRLQGLGHFLQRLSHLALAPYSEASNVLKALPSSVSIPALPAHKV